MEVLAKIKSWLLKLFSLSAKASQWVILAMALIIFFDVVMRYVFNRPTIWTLEISEYMLVFLAFAGAADIQAKNGHIKMDLFYTKFSPQKRRWLDILFQILTATFTGLLLWHSWKMTFNAYQYDSFSNTLLETPLYIPYAIIPLGMCFLLVQSILSLVEAITELGKPPLEG